jgi:hypothetical protein
MSCPVVNCHQEHYVIHGATATATRFAVHRDTYKQSTGAQRCQQIQRTIPVQIQHSIFSMMYIIAPINKHTETYVVPL